MPSSRDPRRDLGDDISRRSGPRIQDVACRAGVAIGTVSNVLNNPEIVTQQTRLKVEAAFAELGFVRNSVARTLAARRTDTVGLVLTNIGNSLFVDIARGAESAAAQAQLNPLVGVIQAATDLDIGVPDDLLVIGYDDDHFASESNIPVSTMSQPGHRMGELAVQLLIEEIRQPSGHIHRTEMLDPHVIPRRSTLRSGEDTSKWKGSHVAHMVGTAHSA